MKITEIEHSFAEINKEYDDILILENEYNY